ncbi:PDZ domain-containing protein [Singulisphaera sp. Ch08]|uniref:PDZ domain-containing protein n=1 Tax=Singulisphaera sp. Ch08 TaxID=3120278 RepID=A0AAU7C9N1_9BACT
MRVTSIRSIVASCLILGAAGFATAEGGRTTAFERYGIGGYSQAIGIRHGFHIESVTPDSDAARDQLKPHDVIVKVDGDVIRSLDHLRAILAEAYLNNAEVTLTYTRGLSITHHVVKSRLGQPDVKSVAKKRSVETRETR